MHSNFIFSGVRLVRCSDFKYLTKIVYFHEVLTFFFKVEINSVTVKASIRFCTERGFAVLKYLYFP